MGVGKRLPDPAGGGPVVEIVLANPSTRPGRTVDGELRIGCGERDVPVEHVVVGLFTAVEADGEGQTLVEFHRVVASQAFAVPAGARRTVPFTVPVPWETPVTYLRGYPLPGMTMGLRVETEIGRRVDPHDLVAVYVYPLPAQERILDAFLRLGFRLRRAGLQAGRIPWADQTLPFYQDIGFWAAPEFADRITEVGLTFVADPYGVDVIIALDRWASVDAGVRTSTALLRVEHATADQTDWDGVVASWVRGAVGRHPVGHRYRDPRYRVGEAPGRGLYGSAGGEPDSDDGGGGETT